MKIWRQLTEHFLARSRASAALRSCRSFAGACLDRTRPITSRLKSSDCLTDVEAASVGRSRPSAKRSDGIPPQPPTDSAWRMMDAIRTDADDSRSSRQETIARCLRLSDRTTDDHVTLARVMESGGMFIRVEMKSRDIDRNQSVNKRLVEMLNNMLSKQTPTSHQVRECMRKLKRIGLKIVKSQLDRDVVCWMWRHLANDDDQQTTLDTQNLEELLKSLIENISQGQTVKVNFDCENSTKNAVSSPMVVELAWRISLENEKILRATKLGKRIYAFCRSLIASTNRHHIYVFNDEIPFEIQDKIEINEFHHITDMEPCAKENCIYVIDYSGICLWKIKEAEAEKTSQEGAKKKYDIVKWLDTQNEFLPDTVSVSGDGQLLMVDYILSILMIYGSDAQPFRSIQLPKDIKRPRHAVKTSRGNFIILHEMSQRVNGRVEWTSVISELDRDGQMTIRRFVPSTQHERLDEPRFIAIDPDERIFVADSGNDRVVLFDSDLHWSQVLPLTHSAARDGKSKHQHQQHQQQQHQQQQHQQQQHQPLRPDCLFYDDYKKQLIVTEEENCIDVFTLSRK